MGAQYHQDAGFNVSQVQRKQTCANGSPWIWHLLKQCISNVREYWSAVMAIVSVLFFLFAAVPQIYMAYKNGKVDQGLSLGFLLFWLGGDVTNAIGCIVTKQQPAQVVMAVLYVNMDIVMILQFLYYKVKNQKRKWCCGVGSLCFAWVLGCITLSVLLPRHVILRKYSGNVSEPETQPQEEHELLGFICGYVASMLYLGSRFPQLYKNFQRQSTEGTSYGLFALAMMGNCSYGLSLILKMPTHAPDRTLYVMHHMPWLFGSFGVVILDCFVTGQFILYHKRPKKTSTDINHETEPLLVIKEDN